jgi:hypothetical protein
MRSSDAYGNTVATQKTVTLTSEATAGGTSGNVLINGTTNITGSSTDLTTGANGILTFSYNIDASNSYRFKAVSGAVTSYSSYFGVGIDLVVPIEMADISLKNVKKNPITFDTTLTYFNTNDYADANLPSSVTYRSEAICKNTGTSTLTITIVDNSSPGGGAKGTIAVPPSTAYTRITGTFTPTAGATYYRVAMPNPGNLIALYCHAARLIVKQTYASKTAIYYPMTTGLWASSSSYDVASNSNGTYGVATGTSNIIYSNNTTGFVKSYPKSVLFRKETTALSGSTIEWFPEAVLGSGTTSQLALYNETAASIIGSAITTNTASAGTKSWLYRPTTGIADSSLTTGNDFGIRIAASSGTAYLYKSGLWVKIGSNLQKARVLHRVGRASSTTTATFTQEAGGRAAIDLTAFKGLTNSSTAYLDSTGMCNSVCSSSTINLLDQGTSDSTIGTTPVYGNTNGTTAVSTTFTSTTTYQRIKSTDTLKLATPASPGERVSAKVGINTILVTPFVAVDTQ